MRREGLRLVALVLWMWICGRAGVVPAARRVRVTLAGSSSEEVVISDYIQILVLREMVLDEEYGLAPDIGPSSILDLGANTGLAARWLASRYPGAAIIAVEPDPALEPLLRRNLAAHPDASVVVAAATPLSGPVRMQRAEERWASRLTPDGDLTVAGLTPSEILDRTGRDSVDMVKIDIEGGEWPLLEGGKLQEITGCIVGELHHDHGGSLDDARAALPGWDVDIRPLSTAASTFVARHTAI